MTPIDQLPLSLSVLLQPELRADPYPFYARLRQHAPVHWDEDMGFWVVTGYPAVSEACLSPHLSRAQGLAKRVQRIPAEARPTAQPVYDLLAKMLSFSDPPDHTRLRALVNKAFTPRRVEQMRPLIQQAIDQLLAEVIERAGASSAPGTFDVMQAFAMRLPMQVVVQMLGLPSEDAPRLKAWCDDLFAIIGVVQYAPTLLTKAAQTVVELTDYLQWHHQQRANATGDDLLTALIAAADEQGQMSVAELVANVVLLLSAGHESTAYLIGNGLLALLRHPTQMAHLRHNPALIPSAVEEMLRYDNSLQILYRAASQPFTLGGRRIEAGQLVNLVIGAANRDPAIFPDPDHFDVARGEQRHLAFAQGIHFCVGAALARLELQLTFTTLLQRFSTLQLASKTLHWQENPTFRGVKSLPIAFLTGH